MNRTNNQAGFTIIELIVTMLVASIVLGSLVGAVTVLITNTALTGTRNGLPTDLQSGLQKIASVIRSSDNVLLYNLTPDDNAPIAKVGEAASVPGPTAIPADDNYRYFWRSTANELILAQPSRGAGGNAIYTDPANGDYTGPRNSIVLYLNGTALYQRSINTTQNATASIVCPGTTATGGCPGDIMLVDNVKTFNVTYLDSAGTPIPATLPGPINNYQARKTTRSVKIDLSLESKVGTKAISASDTSIISFRNGTIPGSSIIGGSGSSTGTTGTTPAYSMTGMFVGPGGLTLGSATNIYGSQLNVKGRVTMAGLTRIGTTTSPITLNVGNFGCGTSPSWPALCGTPPITGPSANNGANIYGTVCATGQTNGFNISNPGLTASCTSPTVTMPTYDRQAYLSSMTTQQPGQNGSCSLLNFSNKTLGPDVLYNSSLINDYIFCNMTIKGNIYVKGDITTSTVLNLTVAESAGTRRPIVVVEGNISMASFISITPNSYGAGIDFISFGSANANCLTTLACSERTDQTLLNNSYNKPVISLNAVTAPGSTFYSYYGLVNVDGFSSVGGVSGQTVTVSAATVSGP